MPRATLLLTAFEPFGGEALNASWELARALDGQSIGGHRVQAVQLPCAFGQVQDGLDQALQRWRPRLVLALGQAAGRAELSFERVAINLDDARIPDNAGAQPVDCPVIEGAAAAYFSRLPIKAMAAAARDAGVPAGISHSAGTFVCNHLFFRLQHRLRRSRVASGFLHVPILPEQADTHPGLPVLALAQQVAGVRAALDAAVARQGEGDLRVSGGTIA